MEITVIENTPIERKCGWYIYEEIGVACLNVASVTPYDILINHARSYLSKTYNVSWEEVCRMAEEYTINWYAEEQPEMVKKFFDEINHV